MVYGDHPPPHFHARKDNAAATVDIDTLAVTGSLPRGARDLVLEWAEQRRPELRRVWQLAQRHDDPGKIAPLP